MGTDFMCGCRTSMGDWFLCDTHENWLIRKLVLYSEEEQIEEVKKKIKPHRSSSIVKRRSLKLKQPIRFRRDEHGKYLKG